MPLTGAIAAQKAERGLTDALDEVAKLIERDAKLAAPKETGALAASITHDKIALPLTSTNALTGTAAKNLLTQMERATPTATGSTNPLSAGTSMLQGATKTLMQRVYTDKKTKAYAAVQHVGMIKKRKAYTRHTKGGKTQHIKAHTTPIMLHPRHGGGANYMSKPLLTHYKKLAPSVKEHVQKRLKE